MSDSPEFVLDRVFDAPREMVWKAWTEPELLKRWYGPGVETIIHEFDLKPGGLWLNEMRWGEMSDLSRITFQEIEPEEKLVWHHSSADANWNVIANPRMADWPRVILTIVTFEDRGAQTNARLIWRPHDATAAEIACFDAAKDGFSKGWGSGYAILDEIFVEMQAAK